MFKTGDILTFTINMDNYLYSENDTIKLWYANCIINSIKSTTYYDVMPPESYVYDNNTNSYKLEMHLAEDDNKRPSAIYGIIIYNSATNLSIQYVTNVGDQLGYNFYINDDCADGNHTIKSDTSFETINEPTCTEKGKKAKRIILE